MSNQLGNGVHLGKRRVGMEKFGGGKGILFWPDHHVVSINKTLWHLHA
jgi:hypothetical protein